MEYYKFEYSTFSTKKNIEFHTITLDYAARFYHALCEDENNPYIEEMIFNHITDRKYDIDTLDAGVILSVIMASFVKSGFIKGIKTIPLSILETRKSVANNLIYAIYAYIIKHNQSYKLEDLKAKTKNEIIELYVLTEVIAGAPGFDVEKLVQDIDKAEKGEAINTKVIEELEEKDIEDIMNSFSGLDEMDL